MAANLQSARYQQFKQLLQKVATRLGEADVRSLVFNQDLPGELKDALGVLQKLEREGLFSDRNINPLAELLRAIERHDLVNNYVQEYIQKFGSELEEEEEEEEEEEDGVSLTKQEDRFTVTKTEYPDISSPEVDYPPRLQKHEIHRKDQAGATPTKLNPENSQTVSRHMPTVNPATQAHHPSRRSRNAHVVGKKQSIKRSKSVSETMSRGDCHQMFQCQHCLKDLSSSSDSGIELQPGASSIGPRRNTDPLMSQHSETSTNAIGQHETKPPKQQQGATKQGRKSLSWLSSFRKKGDTGLNESVTVSWKVKRSEFVGPLFFHKNNCFEKKVKVSAGSGPTRLNLDVNFKLYPNGINWDQDSYSTLKIEVTSPSSQTLSSDVHLQLVVTGADCETGDVITSRQAEWPLHEKACIIKEFIAHEVIKVSNTKYFEFKSTLRVKYSLSKDWVVVDRSIPYLN